MISSKAELIDEFILQGPSELRSGWKKQVAGHKGDVLLLHPPLITLPFSLLPCHEVSMNFLFPGCVLLL